MNEDIDELISDCSLADKPKTRNKSHRKIWDFPVEKKEIEEKCRGIKIDKGIKIWPKVGRWFYAVKKMSVGDSILVHTPVDAINLRMAITNQGFKPVQRKEGKYIRVWKEKR